MAGGGAVPSDEYDFFISHAWRDNELTDQLAAKIRDRGRTVWYDRWNMPPGVRVRHRIEEAIASSRCGIVVLSRSYRKGKWCRWELDSLLDREVEKKIVIAPVWHGVDAAYVGRHWPALKNTMAVETRGKSVEEVVSALIDGSPPDPPATFWERIRRAMNDLWDFHRAAVVAVLGLAAIAAALAIAALVVAGPAYFVGLDGDFVAVYRRDGLPFSEATLLERKSLTVCDLSAADTQAVRAGVRKGSRPDADAYVNELRKKPPPRPSPCSGRAP